MTESGESNSDSEVSDPNKITDAETCLDYLKRREIFLYKMMNDPSHKAMLYFLEVLMNSETPITVDQLAVRFSHKTFSPEMREACGGGSPEGLQEFLQRYPSLFNVRANGQVTSVAIELPSLDTINDDIDGCVNTVNLQDNHSGRMNLSNSGSAARLAKSGGDRRHNVNKNCTFSTFMTGKHKLKCGSTISLLSTPSLTSNSSANSICSYSKHISCDLPKSRQREDRLTGASEHSHCTSHFTDVQAPANCRRSTNPSTVNNYQRSSNVYQPPHIREMARLSNSANIGSCDLCSPSCATNNQRVFAHPDALTTLPGRHFAPTATAACPLHCPLMDLTTCHHTHHCSTTHLTHPCLCATGRQCTITQHCLHCHPVHAIPTVTPKPELLPSKYCVLPPMEKLLLETEAVRFFQQRLLKREERWVPIKSLAGHLSQANPQVRAVVGPQLEFRNFLLKHPHVFEIQGELVSVKDPFNGALLQKRPRDRPAVLHASHSSTNLSAVEGNSTILPIRAPKLGRSTRPKSLVLSASQAADTFALEALVTDQSVTGKRPSEQRRSAHFIENFTIASLPSPSVNSNSCITNISSNSCTPTTSGPALMLRQKTNNTCTGASSEKNIHQNNALQQTETFNSGANINRSTSLNDLTNRNSISISMSANEYRAIMFLRKALEKRVAATTEYVSMSLSELMHVLSTKAPEPVQSAIGWTEVELEEFIRQHTIFFDYQKVASMPEDTGPVNGSASDDQLLSTNSDLMFIVNKRLQRMINIVITSGKPSEENVRMLTNQSGRVFHVAKLWGIIDLGRHEHVFFDKSIFKHVDDLQRHFKVDEILYFNAILAPKESRAKWRATQVWKECDRGNFEKLGCNSTSPKQQHPNDPLVSEENTLADIDSNPMASIDSSLSSSATDVDISLSKIMPSASGKQDNRDDNNISENCTNHTAVSENDAAPFVMKPDKFATTGQQICDADCLSNGLMPKSLRSESVDDSECEAEIEESQSFIESLNKKEDHCFTKDVHNPPAAIHVHSKHCNWDAEVNNNDGVTSTCSTGHVFQENVKSSCDEAEQMTDISVASSTADNSEKLSNYVSSSTGKQHNGLGSTKSVTSGSTSKGAKNNLAIVSELSSTSIAVQTVSTGDIMATQLYHDLKR